MSKPSRYQSFTTEGLENTTLEERLAMLREVGRDAEREFQAKYQNINSWFTADYDQAYVLAYCMRYFLMHDEGYDEEAETGRLTFLPHYLEILQAIALAHPRIYSARPLWYQTDKLLTDMKEVGTLILTRLFNFSENLRTEKELVSYKLRTDVMAQHLAVRNWAYHHQMKSVAEALALAVQQKFICIHGVDPVSFVRLLFDLGVEVEERVNNHLRKLHGALAQNNPYQIQKDYQRAFDTDAMSNGQMKRFWKTAGKDINNLRMLLMAHSDLRLAELFTFSLADLQHICNGPIGKEALTLLFDKLSFGFGDLKDYNQEHIILDNPVHHRPFIKLGDEGYFSALWTAIPHLSLPVLENLVAEDEGLRVAYNFQRSNFLEDEVEALFKKSFPHAQVFKGSKWRGADGKDFENDLLVIIDSFAIVVEAKSGAVTKAAKRGAPKRLFETLKELIEEPSEQALRFIEYLKGHRGQHSFDTKRGVINAADTSAVNYFIPLGVTFYHLGMVGTNLKVLIDAGIVEKNIHELAPSISLTDLQVVFEILDSDAQKIHYLQRRREFETGVRYIADELDLLGFYLDVGFNLGDLDNDANLVFDLSLKSKELDPYFVQFRNLARASKPSLAMTDWWRQILLQLEQRRSPRWLEFAYVLLNLNRSMQEDVERGFRDLATRVYNRTVEERHNWVTFHTAKSERRFVVIAYPYLDEHRTERDEIIAEMIGQALDANPQAKGVAVIGVNVDAGHYPYSVLSGYLSVSLFDDEFAPLAAIERLSQRH